MQDSFLQKIIVFDYATGCIPKNATCYCYQIQDDYAWVYFRDPILDRRELKVHLQVLFDHGRILQN